LLGESVGSAVPKETANPDTFIRIAVQRWDEGGVGHRHVVAVSVAAWARASGDRELRIRVGEGHRWIVATRACLARRRREARLEKERFAESLLGRQDRISRDCAGPGVVAQRCRASRTVAGEKKKRGAVCDDEGGGNEADPFDGHLPAS
jgi:hypothetical protein